MPKAIHAPQVQFMAWANSRPCGHFIAKRLKDAVQMRRTLKDSFWNSIEYATYRQKKDRECYKILCPFLISTDLKQNQKRMKYCFIGLRQDILIQFKFQIFQCTWKFFF